jgi:hypothetical protein
MLNSKWQGDQPDLPGDELRRYTPYANIYSTSQAMHAAKERPTDGRDPRSGTTEDTRSRQDLLELMQVRVVGAVVGGVQRGYVRHGCKCMHSS